MRSSDSDTDSDLSPGLFPRNSFTDLRTQRTARVNPALKECQESCKEFLDFLKKLPGFKFSEANETCQYLSTFVRTGTQDDFIKLNTTIQGDPADFTMILFRPFSKLSDEDLNETQRKFGTLRSVCLDCDQLDFSKTRIASPTNSL